MTKEKEFKTLKDVPKNYLGGERLTLEQFEKELRAEAVKWVKFYRKRDGLDDWERAEGLMEFNNITEEDLK